MTTNVIDIAKFVTFPRAASNWPIRDLMYEASYRHEARKLMLLWVAKNRAIEDFGSVFVLSPDSDEDALQIATEEAEKEIGRALYSHEARLLDSVVRDHCIIVTALRLAAELRAVADALPPSPPKDRALEAEARAGFIVQEIEAGLPVIETADPERERAREIL